MCDGFYGISLKMDKLKLVVNKAILISTRELIAAKTVEIIWNKMMPTYLHSNG
jgi:hypothetical protein